MEGEVSTGKLTAYDHDGRRVIDQYIHDPAKLPEHIDKEAAKKLLEQKAAEAHLSRSNARLRSLSGVDLEVSGEGMKGYYDKIVPAQLQKLPRSSIRMSRSNLMGWLTRTNKFLATTL